MQISAHGATDVGQVRELNEDFHLIDEEICLYVVCDGMGGHAAGDVASKTAAETVQRYIRERREVLGQVLRGEAPPDEAAALLRHGIQSASAAVNGLGKDDPKKRGAGTTCTALIVLGGKGVMGHVGDSRLYMSRSGRVYQLSEDHTFVQEAIRRGMLTPEQAENNPHSNLVTRAVGPNPFVLVDTLVFDILPGDTLLMCSDGLHNYVKESNELSAALRAESIKGIGRYFIDTANERGGADNITALVLRASVSAGTDNEKRETVRAERVSQDLKALGHIVLFSELSMKELVKVANAFEPRDYQRDDEVVREGDNNDTLFVIVSGSAKVVRGGTDVGLLRAGDHFGEMALLSRRPRSATVRTLDDCRMLALSRERFFAILKGDAQIGAKFLWRFAQTLSLRLDDVYALQEQFGFDTDDKTTTQTYGLFPSPFDREG